MQLGITAFKAKINWLGFSKDSFDLELRSWVQISTYLPTIKFLITCETDLRSGKTKLKLVSSAPATDRGPWGRNSDPFGTGQRAF